VVTRACLQKIGAGFGDDRAVVRLGVVSDEFWEIVAAVIPSREGKQGRPNRDHRLLLEGIAWRYRAGCPWRDLPADFGPWQTVWKRHHGWSLDGTYDAMFAAVMAATGTDVGDGLDTVEKLLSVDSTSVRAHQHAAGARSDTLTGGAVELQESRRRAG
jgi:putative transposase